MYLIGKKFKYKHIGLVHVIGVFPDYDKDMNVTEVVIYKYWRKIKQCWQYECEPEKLFGLGIEMGIIKKV